MLDELLEGLPVLIVDDWSEINEQFLEQSYVEINKKFDVEHLEKLTYAYWKRLLVDYQHEIRMSNP
jgi:hypothetical protein